MSRVVDPIAFAFGASRLILGGLWPVRYTEWLVFDRPSLSLAAQVLRPFDLRRVLLGVSFPFTHMVPEGTKNHTSGVCLLRHAPDQHFWSSVGTNERGSVQLAVGADRWLVDQGFRRAGGVRWGSVGRSTTGPENR